MGIIASKLKGWTENLKKFNETYTPGGILVPAGTYVARLGRAEIKDSNNGLAQFVAQFIITEGDQEGSQASMFQNLEARNKGEDGEADGTTRMNDVGFSILRRFVELSGKEWPAEEDIAKLLEKRVAEIAKAAPLYQITVKHREYQGEPQAEVRINKMMESDTSTTSEEPEPEADEPEADAPEAKSTVPDLTEMSREEMKKFIRETDGLAGNVIVTKGMSDDAIRDKITEFWSEVESLRSANQPEEEQAEPEEKLPDDLFAFAQAQAMEDVTEDMTLDAAVNTISEYEIKQEELTADEIELLDKYDLSSIIVKPVAKKAVVKPADKKSTKK